MSLSVKLKIPNRVQPEVTPRPTAPGRYTNKLHFFKKHLLEEVAKKKFALDFMEPVDTEALQVPTYYAVIERPMDVGTIMKRVQNNYYQSVDEAIADFKLVIRNCFTFNRAGDVVFRKGQMLEKFFNKKIKGMPQGAELPCNKDPKALGKPRAGLKEASVSAATQKQCREYLRKLQACSNMTDTHARNHFNAKWESLLKKLDKHYFKSLEEFRAAVDSIFKRYHDAAYMIYESVFEQPDLHPKRQYHASGEPAVGGQQLAELFTAAEAAESGMRQCAESPAVWDSSHAKQLIDHFSATVGRLQKRCDDKAEAEYEDNGAPRALAHTLLSEVELQELLTVRMDSDDDEEEEEEREPKPINEAERRSIQILFAKLSPDSMQEILHQVQQIEGFISDSFDRRNFDVMNFNADTIQLMKKAIAKSVRASSKLNLRDMPQAEKEGLQRSLEEQLQSITMLLNGGRGKKAPRVAAASSSAAAGAAPSRASTSFAALSKRPKLAPPMPAMPPMPLHKMESLSDSSEESSDCESSSPEPKTLQVSQSRPTLLPRSLSEESLSGKSALSSSDSGSSSDSDSDSDSSSDSGNSSSDAESNNSP